MSQIKEGMFVRAVKSEWYPVGAVARAKMITGDLFVVAPEFEGPQRWDRLADWEQQEMCRGIPVDHRWGRSEFSERVFCTKCGDERK
jgi:hypothetical protein